LSVNTLAQPLVEQLLAAQATLGIAVRTTHRGVRVVDAGCAAPGSIAAGLAIADICMGGLGRAQLRCAAGADADADVQWPTRVEVASSHPVLACLASQYAGWSLTASEEEAGGKKYFALGSGPARALACKEPLFEELGYRDQAGAGCLVLETDREPPAAVIDKVLRDTGLAAEALTIVLTPTRSFAGTTQVVARVLEVALHKAHALGFPLARVVEGSASAPLPVPSPVDLEAMGRTNDAILYGGRVHLTVTGDDAAARDLAQRLPSSNSRDYGRSFAEIFKQVEYDFYRIDPMLFAPAEVWVSNRDSGRTWHAGRVDGALLRQLWLPEGEP
jgi:methenyltetrahydromethanopterin cyclohydrolase